MAMETLN